MQIGETGQGRDFVISGLWLLHSNKTRILKKSCPTIFQFFGYSRKAYPIFDTRNPSTIKCFVHPSKVADSK
jgi:hypothetical protein